MTVIMCLQAAVRMMPVVRVLGHGLVKEWFKSTEMDREQKVLLNRHLLS